MTINTNLNLKTIKNKGLEFNFLESGDIYQIKYQDNQINMLRGNLIDGQLSNIYLRVYHNDKIKSVFPLIGLKGKTSYHIDKNKIIYQGKILNSDYQVVLSIYDNIYYYDVLVNKTTDFDKYDLVFTQDVGINNIGAVLQSEAYNAQYLDHKVFLNNLGYTIRSKQNQGVNQILQIGSLNKTVGYATDGFQVFKTGYKTSSELEGLKDKLPNLNYQYEFPLLTLSSEIIETNNNHTTTFYGYYEIGDGLYENEIEISHNHKVNDKYISLDNKISFNNLNIKTLKTYPLSKKFYKRYNNKRFIEKNNKNELLSFFTNNHTHVVTNIKESNTTRPHGHILLSGDLLNGTKNSFASTNWMFGVFSSHLVLGNTSFHKFNSDLRNFLNVQTISGLRIYIKKENELLLLKTPNLYEMGINYTKWYYNLEDDLLEITTFVNLKNKVQRINIKSENNITYNFLLTNQLVMGNNEHDHNIDYVINNNEAIFNFKENNFVYEKHPNLKYRIVSKEEVTFGDESILFEENKGLGLFVMEYQNLSNVTFDIEGTYDKFTNYEFNFEEDLLEYKDFIHSFSGVKLSLRSEKENLSQLEDTLFWFTHNALVHYASPHGLEQSNGAAWGTRDVLQGPLELFMASQKYDLVRKIILNVFSRQFIETLDFPQWYMHDEYYFIQAHDSHGDIIVWPLKALGDYLKITNDFDILKEKVPYMSIKENKWVNEDSSLLDHINKTLNKIMNTFVKGKYLPAYGGGDWNDTLQPTNQKLTNHMVSGWTPLLLYQSLNTIGNVLEGKPLGRRANLLANKIKEDYEKYIIKDGIPAGFVIFEEDESEYLLHPEDNKTGLKYRLLPLTRSIISEYSDLNRALLYDGIIDNNLKFPDGNRLMNTFVTYHGGKKTYFQRAETATNVGREVGILYMHAHLRYIEAMAKLGLANKAYDALFKSSSININKHVKNADLRQSNTYFSSSDADFSDRYIAKEKFSLLKKGDVLVKAGWRLYSSGPGIYINQFISNVLGIKTVNNNLHLDPVLDSKLKGLKIEYKYLNRKLSIHFKNINLEESTIYLNNKNITNLVIKSKDNIYRNSGVIITKTLLNQIKDEIKIIIK